MCLSFASTDLEPTSCFDFPNIIIIIIIIIVKYHFQVSYYYFPIKAPASQQASYQTKIFSPKTLKMSKIQSRGHKIRRGHGNEELQMTLRIGQIFKS